VRPDAAAPTDGQLLSSFIDQKDEAAFAALVERHGRMVMGVCLRGAGHHHDAEDAFQATFLVLARKAASVRPRDGVANWLHGVALRTARNAKAMTEKRRGREAQMLPLPESPAPQHDQWSDLQPILDRELNGLPEAYRLAILLCDIEGKSIKEATQQLGCPQGTLAGRLVRGRKLLAKRLTRRGVTLSGPVIAVLIASNDASAAVPTFLMNRAVAAATLSVAGQATELVSAKVSALVKQALTAMLLTKLKSAAVIFMLTSLIGVGGWQIFLHDAAAQIDNPQKQADENNRAPEAPESQSPKKETVKLQGLWQMESMEGNGMKVSPEDFAAVDHEQIRVRIVGDQWITKNGDGKEQKQTFRVDETKTPRTIVIKALDGRFDQLGVYQLEKDQLKVCLCGEEKQVRPMDFVTRKGSAALLIVYKRVVQKEPGKGGP